MEDNNEDLEDDRCPTCRQEKAESSHTCPYAEEIGGDSTTLCNCCSFCTGQCAMDI
jgi:hypothetical protein